MLDEPITGEANTIESAKLGHASPIRSSFVLNKVPTKGPSGGDIGGSGGNPLPPRLCVKETVIDNGEDGHTMYGNWTTLKPLGFGQNELREGDYGFRIPESQWCFLATEKTEKTVYVTWERPDDRREYTSQAIYTVRINGQLVLEKEVNQNKQPEDAQFDKIMWESLGDITIEPADEVDVFLRNKLTGKRLMFADAARLEPVEEQKKNRLALEVQQMVDIDTAVGNQKDLVLLRFVGYPTTDEPVELTEFIFVAAEGNTSDLVNYGLWLDNDGDGVTETPLETGVNGDDNEVVFDEFSYVFEPDKERTFEIKADRTNSYFHSWYHMRFDPYNPVQAELYSEGTDLEGVEYDGDCNVDFCEITLTTVPSTRWEFVDSGSLYITNADLLKPRQLVGGTNDTVVSLELMAEDEDLVVETLKLTTANVNDSITTVDVEITYPDSSVETVQANAGRCEGEPSPTTGSMFCTSTYFVVPMDESVFIEIKPRIQAENAGGVSGEAVTFSLDATSGFNAIEARGLDSGQYLISSNGNDINDGEFYINRSDPGPSSAIVSVDNVTVFGRVLSIVNAGPVSSNVVPLGNDEFAYFAFETDANGTSDTEIDGLIFEVMAHGFNAPITNFELFAPGNDTSSATVSCTHTGVKPIVVTCSDMIANGIDTELEPDTSTEFALRALFPGSFEASVQAVFTGYSNHRAATFGSDTNAVWNDADGAAGFLWFDLETNREKIYGTLFGSEPTTQCNDGLDNDADGFIDLDDIGCEDASDNDESDGGSTGDGGGDDNPHICENGIDDDGDGLVDFPADPGCESVADNDETDDQGSDGGVSG